MKYKKKKYLLKFLKIAWFMSFSSKNPSAGNKFPKNCLFNEFKCVFFMNVV